MDGFRATHPTTPVRIQARNPSRNGLPNQVMNTSTPSSSGMMLCVRACADPTAFTPPPLTYSLEGTLIRLCNELTPTKPAANDLFSSYLAFGPCATLPPP